MKTHRFTIKDTQIPRKYKFIVDQLKEIEFYIELTEESLEEYYDGRSIDLVWDIGYYKELVRYDFMKYWIDMLTEIIDTTNMTDKEYDLSIDFQRIFEDICVEQSMKFEERIQEGV